VQSPRLLAVVTVLSCFGLGSQAIADYTVAQLREIERLTTERNWGALRTYLEANPELLQGSGELAVELRSFTADVDNGLIEELSARRDPSQGQVLEEEEQIY
jgi:hypothetical protein